MFSRRDRPSHSVGKHFLNPGGMFPLEFPHAGWSCGLPSGWGAPVTGSVDPGRPVDHLLGHCGVGSACGVVREAPLSARRRIVRVADSQY